MSEEDIFRGCGVEIELVGEDGFFESQRNVNPYWCSVSQR